MGWPWPLRSKRQAEGLTGDIRPLANGESAQLIYATWPEPRPILVTGEYTSTGTGTWTLTYGLERGQVRSIQIVGPTVSRIVLARSVQLSCANTGGSTASKADLIVQAQAVAIEANISVDTLASLLLPSTPVFANGPPIRAGAITVPVSVVGVTLIAAHNTLLQPRRGLLIYNHSPAGRTLFATINAVPVTAADAHYRIPPFFTLEMPFNYVGLVGGIWDGADPAGAANIANMVV